MSGVFMEQEDFIRAKDAEIGALREELQRCRLIIERLETEIAELYTAAKRATKDNLDLRKQLQSWADEADAEIQLAKLRRAELEACEL
jgi:predicted RNase H-like nuclease (RuvC/YqgF family)